MARDPLELTPGEAAVLSRFAGLGPGAALPWGRLAVPPGVERWSGYGQSPGWELDLLQVVLGLEWRGFLYRQPRRRGRDVGWSWQLGPMADALEEAGRFPGREETPAPPDPSRG